VERPLYFAAALAVAFSSLVVLPEGDLLLLLPLFSLALSRRPRPSCYDQDAMTTNIQAPAQTGNKTATRPGKKATIAPSVVLFAGWLVPGAGHLLLGKWIRALLLLVSIVAMFSIGIALQGKIYVPSSGDPLDILGFAGDLGAGALYLLARVFDLGHPVVVTAVADYGTKFIVVAGLLNLVAAVDAHSLATGRKQS
jgi:hypothetical protein